MWRNLVDMISNLVLTGRYKIGLDKNDKFIMDDSKLSTKDVPFIRYRFSEYTQDDVEYIKSMKKTFKHSTHLLEFILSDKTKTELNFMLGSIEDIATYIYVPITDEEVLRGLSELQLGLLSNIKNEVYDRIMIKDNSKTLHLVSANKIKKQISEATGFKETDIGICSSPLSFSGEACLTAIRARELTALYSSSEECAIPSANHECMNTCGCIRHKVVTSDIIVPISSTTSSKDSNNKKNGDKANIKKKVSKAPVEWE